MAPELDLTDPILDLIRRHPHGIHLAVTALIGETGPHLVNDHGAEPIFGYVDDTTRRYNAALHLKAHPATA